MRSRDLLFTGLYTVLGSALMVSGGSAIATSLAPDRIPDEWNSISVVAFAVGIVAISQAPSFLMRSRIRELELRVAELAAAGGVS